MIKVCMKPSVKDAADTTEDRALEWSGKVRNKNRRIVMLISDPRYSNISFDCLMSIYLAYQFSRIKTIYLACQGAQNRKYTDGLVLLIHNCATMYNG